MNATTTNNGKVVTKVVYLMAQDPETDRWEPMAYFPDLPWSNGRTDVKTSYMHKGEHGPALDSFVLLDCKVPSRQHMAAIARLHKELEERNYMLTVLDSAEWMASKGTRRKELDANVLDASYVKDSELLMAGTADRKRAIRAARAA